MKFRAWDVTEKCWIPENQLAMTASGELLTYDPKEDRWAIDIICWKLSRFTGLHDKNGKEIYEGDIIRITTKRRLHDGYEFATFSAVIEWENGGYWFRGINHNQTDCNWHFYNECDREVIGSIYENPEIIPLTP